MYVDRVLSIELAHSLAQIMTICKNAKVNYWAADMDLASMKPMAYIPDADEEDDDDEGGQEMPASSNGRADDDDDNEELDDVVEQQQAKLEKKQKRLDEHLQKNPTKDDMVVFKRMNKYVEDRMVKRRGMRFFSWQIQLQRILRRRRSRCSPSLR